MRNLLFLSILFLSISACKTDIHFAETNSMEPTIEKGEKLKIDHNRKPNRNDVVLFDFTVEKVESAQLFRLVALPGDTLKLEAGQTFVNGQPMANEVPVIFNYTLRTQETIPDRFFEEKGLNKQNYRQLQGGYRMKITDRQAEEFSELEAVQSVKKQVAKADFKESFIYPDFKGNRDYLTPVYVPKKGDLISGELLKKYAQTIQQHEGADITGKDSYTFQKNYGFVLGDNRHNAKDSRYIGFIPMEKIEGVVVKFKEKQ